MAVLGGLGSILGSIVGAACWCMLPQVLTVFHDYEHVVLGLIMMLFMIFLRDGSCRRWRACFGRRRVMSDARGRRAVGIAFGGVTAVDGVSFAVQPAEIFADHRPERRRQDHAVQYRLRHLSRRARGRVRFAARTSPACRRTCWRARGLSRTFQNLQIFFRMTAVENVMVGRHLHEKRIAAAASVRAAVGRCGRTANARRRPSELLGFVGLGDARRPARRHAALWRAQAARDRARARDRAEACCCSTSPPPAAMRSRPRRSTPDPAGRGDRASRSCWSSTT